MGDSPIQSPQRLSGMLTMLPIGMVEVNRGQLAGLPKNPRTIQKGKFAKLKANIQAYPEMLAYRSLLVYPLPNGKYIIVGGNMRYRAMKDLGHELVPVCVIPKETPVEKLRAFAILDNNEFGDWDWDMLANEWDASALIDWGLDIPSEEVEEKATPADEYKIEIKCLNEQERDNLYEEFKSRGLECKKK